MRPVQYFSSEYLEQCKRLEPGEILSIYYQVENEGEKPCLMATRWGLGTGR